MEFKMNFKIQQLKLTSKMIDCLDIINFEIIDSDVRINIKEANYSYSNTDSFNDTVTVVNFCLTDKKSNKVWEFYKFREKYGRYNNEISFEQLIDEHLENDISRFSVEETCITYKLTEIEFIDHLLKKELYYSLNKINNANKELIDKDEKIKKTEKEIENLPKKMEETYCENCEFLESCKDEYRFETCDEMLKKYIPLLEDDIKDYKTSIETIRVDIQDFKSKKEEIEKIIEIEA